MKTVNIPGRKRTAQRGFNLIEVLVAVFILVIMALMFAAVVPTTLRSVRTANYYNLAGQIAQRKLDQLMDPNVGYTKMTVDGLTNGPDVVAPGVKYPQVVSEAVTASSDPCEVYDPVATTSGTAPTASTKAGTNYRMTGYFTKLDGLRRFKSNGTPACNAKVSSNAFPGEDNVQGILVVEGWRGKTTVATETSMLRATITINWQNNGQGKSSYTISALIPQTSIL